MQRTHRRGPSTTWWSFLRQHGSEIWACDFFCVQTITFKTLYVFFVIHHASRQVLHVHVTGHPTASWTAQQIVECCGWDCQPPRFLIHDRDSCYGASFDLRFPLGKPPLLPPAALVIYGVLRESNQSQKNSSVNGHEETETHQQRAHATLPFILSTYGATPDEMLRDFLAPIF
jgi:hypothetical protein